MDNITYRTKTELAIDVMASYVRKRRKYSFCVKCRRKIKLRKVDPKANIEDCIVL